MIERRWEFETQYDDRYKVEWFEAMEEVIAESGMFAQGGFGAVGSQRVDEVTLPRKCERAIYRLGYAYGYKRRGFDAVLIQHPPRPKAIPASPLLAAFGLEVPVQLQRLVRLAIYRRFWQRL